MKTGILISAAPQNSPDILYATGFNATDPFIYMSSGRDKCAFVPLLEYSRASNSVKRGVKVFEFTGGTLKATLKYIISKYPEVSWTVPGDFPLHLAEFMRGEGADLKCAAGPLFHSRSVKRPLEIRHIADAMLIAEKAMLKAQTLIADSSVDSKGRLAYGNRLLTSEYLIAQIDLEIFTAGGLAEGTIAACGRLSAEPHNNGKGVISAEQPIVVDIFPRLKTLGYWGDITRTFVKGKPPQHVRKAFYAVKEARDFSKSLIRSGAIASDVYRGAVRILEKHGFSTGRNEIGDYGFFHSLGHGLGLEIHEEPRLSPKNDKPLEAGNVITVEPGLYYPEWGGIRLEDTVVVRKNSAESITSFPTILEIE